MIAAVPARTQRVRVGTLLPLATGLLIVGVNSVVPVGAGALMGLMVVLTLGAVLPGRPWRTGAIVAAPMVGAVVMGAAGGLVAPPAVVVVAPPALVAAAAAAVKAGAVLAGAGPWRPFET